MVEVFLDDEGLVEEGLFGFEIGNLVHLPIFREIAFIPFESVYFGEHIAIFQMYLGVSTAF
jgi:hypothetical protein